MSDRIVLQGSHIAHRHQPVGSASLDESMSVTVILRRNTGMSTLPFGPKARHLDHDTFAGLYGMKDADLENLRAFAQLHELSVGPINRAGRTVRLSGTVAQIQTAFGVSIQNYEDASKNRFRANDAPASIPSGLGPSVAHVLGLSERPVATPKFRIGDAAVATTFTPPQLASIYQFPNGTGEGQCIGIVELGGGYQTSDLQTFFTGINEALPNVVAVSVDGGANVPGGDPNGADPEVELDIEIAGGIAPGATIAVYFSPNTDAGFLDAVTTAIHDTTNNPSVISISWGGPENSWSGSSLSAFDEAFQDAAMLGITVCVAAGDGGSADGTSSDVVDFPASSPNALACGGTSLVANGTTISSETVWNDGGGEATGGGISANFPVPTYQTGLVATLSEGGTEALTGRGVPDIAGNADPNTGYAIVVDGESIVVGGTSAVAPLWAGLIAVINSITGKNQGFINPTLSASVANDVTSGNNGTFAAAVGWDACTGWGSPNGPALLAALTPPTATPGPPNGPA